jgi:hypothetical protein
MTQYPTCSHTKEDGTYCGSPALVNRRYCYFHLNLRGRRLRRAQARRHSQPYRLRLPALENLHAIQVAIGEILEAMAEGQLDPKAGGIMLYGIQQATTVMLKIEEAAEYADDDYDDDEEEAGRPLRVREFPAFEQHYGLPPNVSLEADPDVALQYAEDNPTAVPEPPAPVAATVTAPARTQKKRDPDAPPTFQELKRQLEYMQQIARQPARKPSASVTTEETNDEDCEVPDSA